MRLETSRLLLPPLTRAHVDALTRVYADPEVNRFIGGDALDAAATASQVAAFEAVWQERGYGQSAVLHRESGSFLGRVGLHPWPEWDEVEVGWVLARSAQGQGYATEAASRWVAHAFGVIGLRRLTAVISPQNAPSQRVAVRLGFQVHRQDRTRGVDVLVYELLAADAATC